MPECGRNSFHDRRKDVRRISCFWKESGAEGILYLDGENVTVYDMASGEQETKTLQEFRRNIKMRYLTFALAKGRLANKTMDMFENLVLPVIPFVIKRQENLFLSMKI